MLYYTFGGAVVIAVLVALLKPDAAQAFLNTWQRYKTVLFLVIGGILTYYSLSSGVWYLVLLGGAGVIAGVWAVWFSDWGLSGWAR